jgi:hypothetical protein
VPFSVQNSSGITVFSGEIRDTVTRLPSGDLVFTAQVLNTSGIVATAVERVSRDGFLGYETDVDRNTCGTGSAFPEACRRSGDGDTLDYLFAFAPVFRNSSSRNFWCVSDARQFDVGGRMTIYLQNGLTTVIPISRPTTDTTRPDARITEPAPEACVCQGLVSIRGFTCDPESDVNWTLRARRSSDPNGTNWIQIASSTLENCGSFGLATWDTTGLPDGQYIIELEVVNEVGLSSTAAIEIFLSSSTSPAAIRYPGDNDILGGVTCVEGTIATSCFEQFTVWYLPPGGGGGPVDPSNPVYTSQIVNDPAAYWDTRTVPDGMYTLSIWNESRCGPRAETYIDVEVDNTRPIAKILSITACEWYSGVVEITGEVFDLNIAGWVLEYTGGDSAGWTTIATGSGNISSGGLLANWDTTGLERCAYTVRLRASDKSRHGCQGLGGPGGASDMVSFNVGCYADCNGDGMLDVFDFLCFQDAFVMGCP